MDPRAGDRAVVEYVYLDMWKTINGGQDEIEISPSCLTATDPPATCDPNPRFIAPIELDIKNPDHWVAGGPVRVGRHCLVGHGLRQQRV